MLNKKAGIANHRLGRVIRKNRVKNSHPGEACFTNLATGCDGCRYPFGGEERRRFSCSMIAVGEPLPEKCCNGSAALRTLAECPARGGLAGMGAKAACFYGNHEYLCRYELILANETGPRT